MPKPKNKVRVFVSSTFRDMHAERDHLVTVVFPELRERCQRLGLKFFDVDLRWGVPEKTVDGETANSWEYCRKWIDRVEPFFVCMLGQRYGWEPEPKQLKDADDRARQLEQKRSITDMEVRYAVLNTSLRRHSYFYFRAAEAPAIATDFVDPPPLLAKLDQLKTEVRACGRPVRDYPCAWKDNAFTGMEEFGKKMLDDLWSGILRDERYVSKDDWREVLGSDPDTDPRYTNEDLTLPECISEKLVRLAKPPPKNPLEAEREKMAAFAASRLGWFQGRTKELDRLTTFIHDRAAEAPRLAAIVAPPGQGKSALMAKLSSDISDPSSFIVAHFVGATEQSSTAYALVKRLNDELDASSIEWPEPPTPEGQSVEELKLDFRSLCQRLSERLSDYAGKRRIVLLLDALNQLSDGHDLGWLPHRLGPGVRIVVSCIDDVESSESDTKECVPPLDETVTPSQKIHNALSARFRKPKLIPLGGLDADDVRTIVRSYLLEYCKELDPEHIDVVCDQAKLPQARNPLYLRVMLDELRSLGGNEMNKIVPDLIAEMATKHADTVSLFKWVLQRMEEADGFGRDAVNSWCLYLALGRVGMASRELADLLKRKLHPNAAFTAQRIERGLRRFLQHRGETLDFFHGQLRQAVMEKYGNDAETNSRSHGEIADYFCSRADPSQHKHWIGEHLRPFDEIAFHRIGAQHWDELCDYLTDFRCLDVRIRAGRVFEVVADQQAAIDALPELAKEARREQERVDVCARYGDALIAYAGDCAAGEHPALPVPPATREMTETGGTHEAPSLRAYRLRATANFVGQQSTLLAAFPRDFLPNAANATEGVPLGEAGELADALVGTWLKRAPRPPTVPLKPQCVKILQGHTCEIHCVSLTPDGRRAVSGSGFRDSTLRVWDLPSGQCLHTLQGHESDVYSLSLTPDGRRAVSGGADTTLRVWDLHSGQCIRTLQGHSSCVTSVSLTPDGRIAVSGSMDETVRVWDLHSGQCLHTLEGHTEDVNSVQLTPDGRIAVSGSDDDTVRVWDLVSGQCLGTLEGHTFEVSSVSLTPDGRIAVSGSQLEETLRVWELSSGECLRTITEGVDSVAVTPDGNRAISSSFHKTLRVWNLHSGQCIQTLHGHTDDVPCVSLTPDGRIAVSGGGHRDMSIRVWDLHSGQRLHTLQGHADQVNTVSLTTDGQRAVSGSGDNTVRVWDLNSGHCLHTLEGHTSGVTMVSLALDDRCALSTGYDHSLRVWDLDSGECLHTLKGDTKSNGEVGVTTNGRRALSWSCNRDDGTVRVWDLLSGQCLHALEGHTKRVTSVCLARDGRIAVSGSWDNTLRVWDLDSGQCLQILQDLQGGTSAIYSVNVTPDGRRVVSTSFYNLRVWDLDSGRCLHSLKGHTSQVIHNLVRFTRDSQRAVSGSWDNTLRVWDLRTGHCLHTLQGHSGAATWVCPTPDGSRAVSGSHDKTLRVWDLHTGQCLHVLQGHTERVESVHLTSDGRCAVSGSHDKTLRVWDLHSGQCLAVYHAGSPIFSVAVSLTDDRIVCGTHDGQMHFLTLRNLHL